MRVLGVGSRSSILMLAVALLGGHAACSTGAASTGEDSRRAEGALLEPENTSVDGLNVERAGSAPQQVVQRMVGTATSGGAQLPAAPAAPSFAGEGVEGEARASAAGVSRASAGSLEPRSGSAETITSKHLEAELNRLEAELAN